MEHIAASGCVLDYNSALSWLSGTAAFYTSKGLVGCGFYLEIGDEQSGWCHPFIRGTTFFNAGVATCHVSAIHVQHQCKI
jgi:hypothetical protein